MNRLKKILLSFVLPFFCLLISVSYAMPDIYFYNNFLVGQSPYYFIGGADSSSVYYYPNLGNENTTQGFVTSFDTQLMVGSDEHSYVESIDIDNTVGKIFELPANSCFVLYSGSGSFSELYSYGDYFAIELGTTKPGTIKVPASTHHYDNRLYDSNFSLLLTPDIYVTVQNSDTFIPGYRTYSGNTYISFGTRTSNSPSDYSNVMFVVNPYDTSCYFTTSDDYTLNSSSIPTYISSYTSNSNISMMVTNFSYSSAFSYPSFILPHIKGDIDIYSNGFEINTTSSNTRFKMDTLYNITCSAFVTDDGMLAFAKDFYSVSAYGGVYVNNAFIEPQPNLMPFFLNNVPYLYDKAIYIKDGYVAITNYDELIAKLKQAGVGQGDLTRVVELLEEINTGGLTGQEARELMTILEQYHNSLMEQADFDSFNAIFDEHKDLLEFTQDMQWLIIANNALFEYFIGFVVLCAFFLVLQRILR